MLLFGIRIQSRIVKCSYCASIFIVELSIDIRVGINSLLRQGLSEREFYGDLVYKLKKIVGSNNFNYTLMGRTSKTNRIN